MGAFIKEQLAKGTKRSQMFVTSKVPGCGIQGVGSGKQCGPDTAKFFTEDLKDMGIDYADLVMNYAGT